jgi:ubiquinone/menaquinone biosynthesis C-methylase UbiE
MTTETEYVLGTTDAEIQRLGLQHAVWVSDATRAWRAAGFRPGNVIIDVGAGPGFATLDLAELVGPSGSVYAIDQSARFAAHTQRQAAARGLQNIVTTTADLDEYSFEGFAADGAWIRWVLAFVRQPRRVLSEIARALRPGGRIVIHEYFAYETWKVLPRDEQFERFVAAVMLSWRRRGGEPNVGLDVVPWLEELGFRILSTRTIAELVRPTDSRWYWPTTFALSGVDRLVELGDCSAVEGERLRAHMSELFAAGAWTFTPGVLEVIADLEE